MTTRSNRPAKTQPTTAIWNRLRLSSAYRQSEWTLALTILGMLRKGDLLIAILQQLIITDGISRWAWSSSRGPTSV